MEFIGHRSPSLSTSPTSSSATLDYTHSQGSPSTSWSRSPTGGSPGWSSSSIYLAHAPSDPNVVLQWPPPEQPPIPVPVETRVQAPVRAPHMPLRYRFSSTGRRSMLVVPSADAPNAQPLYNVAWRDDFWTRDAIVTSVRRGASENGQLVGEFG